jgi:predicted TIM-barrel fold metal-dependent hydrolase
MSTTTPSDLRSVDDLPVIVDCDAHVTDDIDDLLPFFEDRYSGIAEIISKGDRAASQTVYQGSWPMPPFIYSEIRLSKQLTGEATAKLGRMDEFGIDRAILSPGLNLRLAAVANERWGVALANAYNSWIIDEWLDDHDRLKGGCVAAPQDPRAAADEIDRVASEDDIVAVHIPGTGLNPAPGHSQYDPIYESAARHDLPVVMHGSSAVTSFAFPVQRMLSQTYAEDHALVHPFTAMRNLTNLVLQGVPEKFPDLDIVIQEAGIGWIPYLLWRLDDHYFELSYETPLLDKPPSEYVEESFHFTTQPLGHTRTNPKHIAQMIDMVGHESILYSSDLPHADFDPPNELFDRINSHFDDDAVRGMMDENGAELFGV